MGEGTAHCTAHWAKAREGAADQLQIQHRPIQTLVETPHEQGGLSGKAPVVFVNHAAPAQQREVGDDGQVGIEFASRGTLRR